MVDEALVAEFLRVVLHSVVGPTSLGFPDAPVIISQRSEAVNTSAPVSVAFKTGRP